MILFEIIPIIFKLMVENFISNTPRHLVGLIVFAVGSLFIKYIGQFFYYLKWNKELKKYNSDLIDGKLYLKSIKQLYLDRAEKDYFNKRNDFKTEALYFVITTIIFIEGLRLENKFLFLIFYIIQTARFLLVYSRINLDGINLVKYEKLDEREIYCNIYLSNCNEFSEIFKQGEVGLIDELPILELKFRELALKNKIDKELIFDLINSKQITTSIKEMINLKYSELTH